MGQINLYDVLAFDAKGKYHSTIGEGLRVSEAAAMERGYNSAPGPLAAIIVGHREGDAIRDGKGGGYEWLIKSLLPKAEMKPPRSHISVHLVRYKQNGKSVFWHQAIDREHSVDLIKYLDQQRLKPELITRRFTPHQLVDRKLAEASA